MEAENEQPLQLSRATKKSSARLRRQASGHKDRALLSKAAAASTAAADILNLILEAAEATVQRNHDTAQQIRLLKNCEVAATMLNEALKQPDDEVCKEAKMHLKELLNTAYPALFEVLHQAYEESRTDEDKLSSTDSLNCLRTTQFKISCLFCYEEYDLEVRKPMLTRCCSRRLCSDCAILYGKCPYGDAFGCPSAVKAVKLAPAFDKSCKQSGICEDLDFVYDIVLAERWKIGKMIGFCV